MGVQTGEQGVRPAKREQNYKPGARVRQLKMMPGGAARRGRGRTVRGLAAECVTSTLRKTPDKMPVYLIFRVKHCVAAHDIFAAFIVRRACFSFGAGGFCFKHLFFARLLK